MTAINVVRLLDCVHIVSDGAAIDATGSLIRLIQKVTPIAHLNCVVGIRGSRMAICTIWDALATVATSYDDLHFRIVDVLRSTIENARTPLEKQFGSGVLEADVVVAGISETQGPHAYIVATSDANAAYGLKAWSPLEIPGHYLSPSDAQLHNDFARLQLEFSDDRAIELVNCQRSIAAPLPCNPNAPGPYGVGGFCQLTTVRPSGIETRILKRWPDKLGQQIQPRAGG